MSSTDIFIDNLRNFYLHQNTYMPPSIKDPPYISLRYIANKINVSSSTMLNWSAKRSSPSINHLIETAFIINTEPYQLLIKDNPAILSTETYWKPYSIDDLYKNLKVLQLEKGVNEGFFAKDYTCKYNISYRNFMYIINGKRKSINLKTLDDLSVVLSVEPYLIVKGNNK